MTKFLYVLLAILSALVTVWCSLSWTYCVAGFLGLILLLLLEVGGVLRRVRLEEEKWSDGNDIKVDKTHQGNNSTSDLEDKTIRKGQINPKKKNSVNASRNRHQNNQNLWSGSDSEDEEIPGSVSSSTNTRSTTTLSSIMSNLERSISNSRLLSLFSVFNKSNSEGERPVSPPVRCNITGDKTKNGRQTLKGNRRRMAVQIGTSVHMSSSMPPAAGSMISKLDNTGIIGGSPLSKELGRINAGYETSRTARKSCSTSPYSHQRQGRFSSQVPSSSPLTNSPLPRFHRTTCETPDRPGINPVGFTPHILQRPEVSYPNNSSPGRLPHVRLEKRIKIPLVESNINKMRSPVTVRIAPPETGVINSPKFTSLRHSLDFSMTPDTSDVLSALREGTRKRTNMAGSDEDSFFDSANNTAKRRRQESNHSTASSSSMPSLPDFLPDLSLCNFTPSSYMSSTSRYMVPSSAASIGGSVMNSSHGMMVGSSGINTGVKRPVAPCAHLSQAEASPSSKRPRQEVKNNSILSSLSSSRRFKLHMDESVKRKKTDSIGFQDPVASKENQETLSSDNQQPASKSSKVNQTVMEAAGSEADPSQISVSPTSADRHSEDAQASVSEPKTPDLRSRRKHLSFASPSVNMDKLSYANVYATKQDYENDRKAEQERVEKMLDRIATEKKAPDADLLTEKNVVGSSECTTLDTSALTVLSTTTSPNSKALTCTTTATSLKVSTTTASLTSSSSSKDTNAESSSSLTSTTSHIPATSSSILSSAASTATITIPSTSTLSSLLQSSSSANAALTPSSPTSSATLPQTTTDLPSTSTKPAETSSSLPSTSIAPALASDSAFQPTLGSPATTSVQSPSTGSLQFDIKNPSDLSSIPSTTTPVAISAKPSGFGLGTFSTASTMPATTALISTTSTFAFGASTASPQTTAFTTGAPTTTITTANAGSLPSKDAPKPGGFSFSIVNPQATPISSATPKTDSQQVSSPFSAPKTQTSTTFSSTVSSGQASTASTTTSSSITFGAATATSPATGTFTFGKSVTPVSLPQSSNPATSNIPTTGMFSFKPNEAANLKTSSASVPTSNPTSMFTFKGAVDSTSTIANPPASSESGFTFGASASTTSVPSFGSSSKAPPAYGAATSGNTFGSASTKFGASSKPTFGATTPTFGATTTSAPTPAFGGSTPAFGVTSTTSAPTPAFGGSSPAFRATSTTSAPTAAFGAPTLAFGPTSTTSVSTPAFGATSTSTPVFGASSSSTTPAFASPTSAASPLFGSTTKASAAFGATSSPFGASSSASTAFGVSNTAFGAPSSTAALFGGSSSQTTQANTSSTSSFPFQTNSNTAQQTSSTSAPSTGFNFSFNAAPSSQNPFNFGSGGTSSTTTSTTTTTTSTAPSGSTSIFGQASSTFSGFSSAGQDGQKSMFGSTGTNQSGSFNFSSSSTNQSTNVFGQTAQQPQASNIFQNSDQQQTSQSSFAFGQGTPSGNTTTPFGQSSTFSSPQTTSFGSFGAKPNVFGTPTNNSDKPSQPAPNIFGSTPTSATSSNVTAQPKPMFGQVAPQPFGGSSTSSTNTGNTGVFGSTPTGQTTTPAAASATPGIFTFGQSSGAQPPAATPNKGFDFSASVGGPSFNFGQGAASSNPTMFNMGSGSTAPKMRSFYPKARRRGAKK